MNSNEVFLTSVPVKILAHPITTLLATGLLENTQKGLAITPLGEAVVDYPLESGLALCAEKSLQEEFQCSEEILRIVSILSV